MTEQTTSLYLNRDRAALMISLMDPCEESLLSPEWRSASSAERKVAIALFACFEEGNSAAFVQGNPAQGETAIDGHYQLISVAKKFIRLLEQP